MRYKQNKKFIDPRYFMDEKTDKVLEEVEDLKMVGSDSNQVRDPAAATSTGEDQMQKLIDAGVDPGDLNACRRDGGDLVKCLWQKNTGYTGAMRKAGLIPAQPGG